MTLSQVVSRITSIDVIVSLVCLHVWILICQMCDRGDNWNERWQEALSLPNNTPMEKTYRCFCDTGGFERRRRSDEKDNGSYSRYSICSFMLVFILKKHFCVDYGSSLNDFSFLTRAMFICLWNSQEIESQRCVL